MKNMKYKVGDRVKIKSRKEIENLVEITNFMLEKCETIMTIESCHPICASYHMSEDNPKYLWADEMIEGLVEEETKVGTALNPIEPKSNANCLTMERVDKPITKIDNDLSSKNQNVWELPNGYIFKDENGNVINATKIILEKKKGYPKTYEESCKVMNYCCNPVATKTTHKEELIRRFQFLLLYRDAYWKIAGDWKPDWTNTGQDKYVIEVVKNTIVLHDYPWSERNNVLAFPTAEMRDTFFEYFEKQIKLCKELL